MKRIYLTFITLAFCSAAVLSSCSEEKLAKPDKGDYEVYESSMTQGVLRIKVTPEVASKLEAAADVNGDVIKMGVKSSDDILQGIGMNNMRRTFRYAGKFEPRTRAEGLHLWYDVYFDTKTPLTKAHAELKSMEGVTIVEYRPVPKLPDYKIIPAEPAAMAVKSGSALPFNDPQLPQQWHYYNDGTYRGLAECDVNVLPVWENITTGDPKVIVAVVDGGIDVDHEDISGNVFINEAELNGQDGVDDDNNGFVDDIYGHDFVRNEELVPDNHGTHVAGTIAAVNNNGIGVSGIAGGDFAKGQKGVRLLSCQIFRGNSGGNSAEAIKYGADMGAVICQNSWGYNPDDTIPASDKEAIDYFIKYAGIDENGNQTGPMKGGVVIFAAGNDMAEGGCPAYYEPVVAVTSIGADYKMAWYSNYGDYADICATGGDSDKDEWVLSTIINQRYGLLQGTSMACPHVSGIAALIVSQYGGPGFTPEELKARLLDAADPIIYDGVNLDKAGKLGRGLVNAYKSISPNENTSAPGTPEIISAEPYVTDAVITIKVPTDNDGENPFGFNIFYSKEQFNSSDVTGGGLVEGMKKTTVRNTANANETINIAAQCLEDDTKYYLAVQAYDIARNRSGISEVVEVTTGFNNPPVVANEIPEILVPGVGHSVSVDLSKYITDEDNDILTYTCDLTSDQAVEVSFAGNTMIVKGLKERYIKAELIATDHRGKSVNTSFYIDVKESGINYLCYPNPVVSSLYIKNRSDEQTKVEIQILSAKGNVVYQAEHEISSSLPATIDMSKANSGNYVVSIKETSGKVSKKNIVKL